MKFIVKKEFWALLLVLVSGVLASRHLFGVGYFSMHDDLQMMRQLQMEKCFLDGQFPCRWVPDMGFGFGFPLFNFYPPLPYLVGQGIRVLGFEFVDTAKILFAISLIASGLAMYLLAKQFFGRTGGVLASVFYVWVPYHAVDVFVRGAMNESWALIWFPLILWSSYKLISDPPSPRLRKGTVRWIIVLALSWFGLLTSHNLMVMIFTPLFGVWALIWLVYYKAYNKIPHLILVGLWAFGLAAFFTLPAVFENKYTHIESAVGGYYDYSAHYASIKQLLFSRFWGYGPSVWLEADDGMSFQIGHVHWIGSMVVGLYVVYRFIRRRKIDRLIILGGLFFVSGWFSAFLVHSRSVFIWKAIYPLEFLQFPWRMLALVILSFSVLIGTLVYVFPRGFKRLGALVLIVFLVAWNWNYFRPNNGKLGPLTDEEKFSGEAWKIQQTAGIYDYLPKAADVAPTGGYYGLAEFMEGEGVIGGEEKGTDWFEFDVDVESELAVVRINNFDFPGWTVRADGEVTEHYVAEEEVWGRMWIELPAGEHKVTGKFEDTPVRSIGNSLSLVSWLVLGGVVIYRRKDIFT